MTLKKSRIISCISIFIISFPIHFLYDFFPNFITALISPVNESIWEHMKILTTSRLLYSLIDYFILRKNHLSTQNFKFQLSTCTILSIPLYLAIYLPIYNYLGENLFISIILLLITYIIIDYLSYKILSSNTTYNLLNQLAPYFLVSMYIIFGYLTYNPPKTFLFYDTTTQSYGIKEKQDY